MHHIISRVTKGFSRTVGTIKRKLLQVKSSISGIRLLPGRSRKKVGARAGIRPMKASRTRVSVSPVYTKHRYASRRVNKKRFTVVVAIATVAVMVPVMVMAANGDTAKPPAEPQVAAAEADAAPAVVDEATPSATDELTDTTQVAVQESTEVGTADAAEVTAEAAPTPEPTPTPAPTPQYTTLTAGMNDASVPALQQRLMDLHYMSQDQTTDYFGPATLRAVQAFQRKHGLAMDGAAGAETQAMIFSDTAKEYTAAKGADGEDVSLLQERLQSLGYEVSVTGHFGDDTEKAVKYFQRMNGLDADGSVGSMTKDVLFSDNAEKSEEKVKAEKKQEEAESKKNTSGNKGSSSSSGSNKGSGSSGSSSNKGGGGSAAAANPGSVEAFIDAAMAQVGKGYTLGAKGPDEFDCSGFIYYALKQSGNGIGYMTSGGWAGSSYASVGWDDLQRGDIVCLSGHVAIYLGGGQVVDASSSQDQIVVRSMGSYFSSRFITGKRPL